MRGLEVYFGMLPQGFHRRRLGNTEVKHWNCCKRNGNKFLMQAPPPSPRDSNFPFILGSLGSCVLLGWGSSVLSAQSTDLPASYNIIFFLTKINVLEITHKNRRSKNQFRFQTALLDMQHKESI